jgi:hypothetical protein
VYLCFYPKGNFLFEDSAVGTVKSDLAIDESFLRQLAAPLLTNDICFTPEDQKFLSLSTESLQKQCDSLDLMISRITNPSLAEVFDFLLHILQRNMKSYKENKEIVSKNEYYQREIRSLLKSPFLIFDFNLPENKVDSRLLVSFPNVAIILLEKLFVLVQELRKLMLSILIARLILPG